MTRTYLPSEMWDQECYQFSAEHRAAFFGPGETFTLTLGEMVGIKKALTALLDDHALMEHVDDGVTCSDEIGMRRALDRLNDALARRVPMPEDNTLMAFPYGEAPRNGV